MKNPPNVLVIGAAGGVANAFLLMLSRHRHLFAEIHLMDRQECEPDALAKYAGLRVRFHKLSLRLPSQEPMYRKFLMHHKIRIVIDLTTLDTFPILEATDRAGVSYVNTSLNSARQHAPELMRKVFERSGRLKRAVHVLCAGMNPGAVNAFVRYGIQKHGVPDQVTHFEFDTSEEKVGWRRPLITWSRKMFINEMYHDPGGWALGRDRVRTLRPNALTHLTSMKSILEPLEKRARYPMGAPVLHEENLTIARVFDVPSKFIYAIHPKTMKALTERLRRKGELALSDLALGDNVKVPLKGEDMIGVLLEYPHRRVYYVNAMSNDEVEETNATYAQVAIGLLSAIMCMLHDPIEPGVHFTGDLYDHGFGNHIFEMMRVEESVFQRYGNRWKRVSTTPRIGPRENRS